MSGTKKGNDSDDDYAFDPFEALADVVTGDAFTFFDEPIKAVEKAAGGTNVDGGAAGGTSEASGRGGSERQQPAATIKPLPAPAKKGKAPGEQESAEGGKPDTGGKEGDGTGGNAGTTK